ncbi:uncharacterized protein G2W53_013858 [Senna tora]|uniref:Uncharacterized protein n=1 Tax=Senna tora TaxID=362788 RepID=A0A834TZN6_9FABA|nr:uncharacterized protein G2W53_013858 [Senna tora]
MSSNRSYGTNHNVFSRAFPLGRPMYMGYPNNPLGLRPYRGSTEFHHSNVEAVRSFMRRFPSLSRNLLLKKYHNQNRHSSALGVLCSACRYKMNNFSGFKDFNPHPGLQVSKLVDMKRLGFANLYKLKAVNAVKAHALKRPRLRSSSHVGLERNLPTIELHLFKDKMNSIAATDGKENVDEANMDLSLHL